MLLGTYTPKLDDKGRVILPAKFREELAGGIVVTRGQENCLYVFSTAEFEQVHERMRMFLSGASSELPDTQNRITLPVPLRTYAGLDRDLVVIGAGSHAEIWDAEAWNTYLAATESGYSEMEEEVIPGLF